MTWPAGKSGFTTVLQSIPVSSGEHAAATFAKKAANAGLPKVGYLTSSDFSSLHPGYYVVFSGIYSSSSAAAAGVSAAHAAGFPAAYARPVTR